MMRHFWTIAVFVSLFATGILAGESARNAPGSEHASELYLKTVKPIFIRKCFDCHGEAGHLPWYHEIPGVKQLLDRDIREARADVDMSQDFPFIGKGSPGDYLQAIDEVVSDGSMPPLRYRILHPDSALSATEKVVISNWLREGMRLYPASE